MKRKQISIATIILSFCILLGTLYSTDITSFASNHNFYRGKNYTTEEELAELEEILRSENYICVSEWCSDDIDITNHLYTMPLLSSLTTYFKNEDYKVFIYKYDYEPIKDITYSENIDYENEIINVIVNAVVIDYFSIRHSMNVTDSTGKIDGDIPSYIPKGTLIIQINNDFVREKMLLDENPYYDNLIPEEDRDKYENNGLTDNPYSSLKYVFVFRSKTTNEYFTVEKYPSLSAPNEIRVELPEDKYSIYKAYYCDQFISDCRKYSENGFTILNGDVTTITIPFIWAEDFYADPTDYATYENQYGETVVDPNIAIQDNSSEYNVVSNNIITKKQKKDNSIYVTILVLGLSLALVGSIGFVVYKKIKENNNIE